MAGVPTVDDGSIYIQPSSAVAALNDDFIPSIDVSKWKWINVGIGSTSYSAVLTPQWSNDGSTWNTLKMYPVTTLDAGDVSAAGTSATNVVLGCFVSFQFFRMRATSYTSGSPAGYLQLQKEGLSGFQLATIYARSSYGQMVKTNAGTVLTSGAVNADSNSGDFQNLNARGVKIFITTGAFGAGASNIIATLQGRDPDSGTYYDILASAALSASSFTVLTAYPGMSFVPNVSINDILPTLWRVKWAATAWGTGGSTLGISCSLSE